MFSLQPNFGSIFLWINRHFGYNTILPKKQTLGDTSSSANILLTRLAPAFLGPLHHNNTTTCKRHRQCGVRFLSLSLYFEPAPVC